jgi:hypothetical protein
MNVFIIRLFRRISVPIEEIGIYTFENLLGGFMDCNAPLKGIEKVPEVSGKHINFILRN